MPGKFWSVSGLSYTDAPGVPVSSDLGGRPELLWSTWNLHLQREDDFVWVLGNYQEFVEFEARLHDNKYFAGGFLLGYLQYRQT